MSYNAFSLYCKTRIDYISGMFKGLLWFDKWNETNWKYEHLRGVPRWIFTPFAMRSNPLLYLEEGLCLCCLQLLVYYMNDNIKLEKDDFWVPMRKFFSPPMRNFESPRGIESQTFGFRAPMLWHPKVWGSIPHGLRIFSLSYARDKTKNFFLYFFTVLKIYYLSYSIANVNLLTNYFIILANSSY